MKSKKEYEVFTLKERTPKQEREHWRKIIKGAMSSAVDGFFGLTPNLKRPVGAGNRGRRK